MPLLHEDEPSPVKVLGPQGASDFFLTADHAGRALPRRLGSLGLTDEALRRHIAWDIGIAEVTAALSAKLDATAILQTYSRLAVDCNRPVQARDAIPLKSEATDIPGNRDLGESEITERYEAIFSPYHRAIETALDARAAAGRKTIFLAMHSFTPVYLGVKRPMHIGILYNRDRRLAEILLDLLLSEGDLIVGDNEPYSVSDLSDYGIPTYGEKRGLPHAEIEIRQDLIGDPVGAAEWADRLARVFLAAAGVLEASGCP
jgi:predicted N-formylglutamate amidohydrolase